MHRRPGGRDECARTGHRVRVAAVRNAAALAESRRPGGHAGQDGVEQAREALVEIRSAQAVQAGRALFALVDHAGFAQDAEMVGQRRLGDVQVDLCARYELEMEFDSVPGLIERFELRFPGEAV